MPLRLCRQRICTATRVWTYSSYIRHTYGKYEVQQESAIVEFVEKCRRKNSEEHQAFGGRYKTLLAKLKRIGVVIPDSLAVFVYWRKAARLNEIQRQQVLTSTRNRFVLDDMMEAVAIQYPHIAITAPHGANPTFGNDIDLDTASSSDEDPGGGNEGMVPAEIETVVQTAYATFQNAKRKLREARNARGYFRRQKKPVTHGTHVVAPPFAESQNPRILALKQQNPCHSCKKKTHWQYDPD